MSLLNSDTISEDDSVIIVGDSKPEPLYIDLVTSSSNSDLEIPGTIESFVVATPVKSSQVIIVEDSDSILSQSSISNRFSQQYNQLCQSLDSLPSPTRSECESISRPTAPTIRSTSNLPKQTVSINTVPVKIQSRRNADINVVSMVIHPLLEWRESICDHFAQSSSHHISLAIVNDPINRIVWKSTEDSEIFCARIFTAKEIHSLCVDQQSTDRFVSSLKSQSCSSLSIVLIESKSLQQSLASQRNRQFQESIRKQNSQSQQPSSITDWKAVEDWLWFACLTHNVHLVNYIDTINQLPLFLSKMTESASLLLSQQQTDFDIGFCPKEKIKSGCDPKDTWKLMLLQIPRMSIAAADAITTLYPSITSLIDAYHTLDPASDDGSLLLQDLVINKGGTRLGPVLSARIFRIIHSTDQTLYTPAI